MKKSILYILLIVSMFSLSACDFVNVSSDQDIADENIKKLIECLENEDSEGVRELFASNIIEDIENFDESIDDLFAYYDGTYEAFADSTGSTIDDTNEDVSTKLLEMSYKITTTEDTYRMAFKWYIKDTGDDGNVGIWSFYIIKNNDVPQSNQRYSYWGDGSWANGLYVGLPYVSYYFEQFLESVENNDKESIRDLFAPNIIEHIENFDETIDELLLYYNSKNLAYNALKVDSVEFDNDGVTNKYYTMTFGVFTSNTNYLVALKWYTENQKNNNNIGIWSCYIITTDDVIGNYSYIGDGLWSNGIYIGISSTYPEDVTE